MVGYIATDVITLFVTAYLSVGIAILAVALWDAGRRPESAWRAINKSQILWMIFSITLPGALIYLLWIRPKVRAAQESEI